MKIKYRCARILCFIGKHKWVGANNLRVQISPYPLRACSTCKKVQEGTYDMAYGCTNWMDV